MKPVRTSRWLCLNLMLWHLHAPGTETRGLVVTIQPEVFHFHGEVPDTVTAVGLHQITDLAAPGARCLDDVAIRSGAPALIQPKLIAGLLSELSLSTGGARLEIEGTRMRLLTSTKSRVAESAILARVTQLKKAGFDFDNQLTFVETGAQTPETIRIALAAKQRSQTARPDFDTHFLIAESERITLDLAEQIVAESRPKIASPVFTEGIVISGAEPVAPPALPRPEPQRGITFPPETFVLTGRQRSKMIDFAEEILARPDIESEQVILRISLPPQAGATFTNWIAEEQLDSVKLGLISRGVAGKLLRAEVIETENPADAFENHIAVILPDLPEPPEVADAESTATSAGRLLPAQEMSSLSLPNLAN